MDNTIKERVLTIIASVMNMDKASLNEKTIAKEVKGWDSLKHMRLMMTLESEFGVKFKPQQMITMTNVGAVIANVFEQIEK